MKINKNLIITSILVIALLAVGAYYWYAIDEEQPETCYVANSTNRKWDVNNDGVINNDDNLVLQDCVTNDCYDIDYDMNCDGVINADDDTDIFNHWD